MLGPILVGNPWLTLRIIRTAAESKGISIDKEDPSYDLEIRSFALKKEFIESKKKQQSRTK